MEKIHESTFWYFLQFLKTKHGLEEISISEVEKLVRSFPIRDIEFLSRTVHRKLEYGGLPVNFMNERIRIITLYGVGRITESDYDSVVYPFLRKHGLRFVLFASPKDTSKDFTYYPRCNYENYYELQHKEKYRPSSDPAQSSGVNRF